MELNITIDWVILFASGAMAVFFDYFPWVAAKFDAETDSEKRIWMFVIAAAIAGSGFLAKCMGWLAIAGILCEPIGVAQFIGNLALAIASMFGVHKATKPSEALKARMFKR